MPAHDSDNDQPVCAVAPGTVAQTFGGCLNANDPGARASRLSQARRAIAPQAGRGPPRGCTGRPHARTVAEYPARRGESLKIYLS